MGTQDGLELLQVDKVKAHYGAVVTAWHATYGEACAAVGGGRWVLLTGMLAA